MPKENNKSSDFKIEPLENGDFVVSDTMASQPTQKDTIVIQEIDGNLTTSYSPLEQQDLFDEASGVALPSRREAACSTSAFAPATFSLTAFPNALAEPRRAAARRLLTGPAARTAAQSAEWTSVMV